MRTSIRKPILISLALTLMFAFFAGCDGGDNSPSPKDMTPVKAQKSEVPDEELRRMAELSDVRIKLRRNKDGTYSYEISGDDPQAVIDADKKLDEYVSGRGGTKR